MPVRLVRWLDGCSSYRTLSQKPNSMKGTLVFTGEKTKFSVVVLKLV